MRKGAEDIENPCHGSDSFNLAALYALGLGVPQDEEASLEYLVASAASGYLPAVFYCASYQANGLLKSSSLETVDERICFTSLIGDDTPPLLENPHAATRIRITHKFWLRTSSVDVFIHGHKTALQGITLETLLQQASIETLHTLQVEGRTPTGNVFRKPLLHHIALHDPILMELVLRRGAEGSILTHDNESLLHVACECGCVKLVELLLEVYPKLAQQNTKTGISPLHWLFMFDDAEIPVVAQMLGERGASTEQVGVKFLQELNIIFAGPPINWAITARNICAVRAVISLGIDVNLYTRLPANCSNFPPYAIDLAASLLLPEITEVLAAHGALVDGRAEDPDLPAIGNVGDKFDPFVLWLYHGNGIGSATRMTIEVLLKYGASLEDHVEDILTFTTHNPSVLEQFLRFNPKITNETISMAAMSSRHDPLNCKKMDMILDYCATHLDKYSFRLHCIEALPICVGDGSISAVQSLLRRLGNNTRAVVDDHGLLHVAAENDHVDMIDLLLSHGGSLNLDSGSTPAGTAAFHSKRQALGFLLSRGADMTHDDCTILHDIVSNSSPAHESEETLKMVCSRFRDSAVVVVNDYNSQGFTALHAAVVWGSIKNVSRLILELNADGRNIKNSNLSPTDVAAFCMNQPPGAVLRGGIHSVIAYKKSMRSIIDYLESSIGLPAPKPVVSSEMLEDFLNAPQADASRHYIESEWYTDIRHRYITKPNPVRWWGIWWKPDGTSEGREW